MAEKLTGLAFLPKLPLADGGLFACGYGGYDYWPPQPRVDPEQKKREEEEERRRKIEKLRRQLEDLEKLDTAPSAPAGAVFVPEGAMEWLLHEVGHWVVSDDVERASPSYGLGQSLWGHDARREVEAWGFQHLVLAPFGNPRLLAPPSQQDGAAFRPGPLPTWAMWRAGRRAAELGVDLDAWRALYREWVEWGHSLDHRAPWKNLN